MLGNVIVRSESVANCRDVLHVTFSCNNLVNKEGFFSKSDPFLVISRLNEDGSYSPVWKSNHIDNTLSPKWKEVIIPMSKLCNSDLHRPLKIEVFDFEKSGKHVFMGQATGVSVNSMISNGTAGFNIMEPEKQARSNYKNSGTLHAQNVSVEHIPTFADVSHALDIQYCVCALLKIFYLLYSIFLVIVISI